MPTPLDSSDEKNVIYLGTRETTPLAEEVSSVLGDIMRQYPDLKIKAARARQARNDVVKALFNLKPKSKGKK